MVNANEYEPLELSHLHPAAQPVARLPAAERVQRIRADRWIGYPKAVEAVERGHFANEITPVTMPDGTVMNIFGEGGGEQVAERLTQLTDSDVALLGSIPLDPTLREHGDTGTPVVISEPDSPAAKAIRAVADHLKVRRGSLAGKNLNPRVK